MEPGATIGPDTRPKRRNQILNQRAEDTLVLLDPDSGNYYSLDGIGDRVWELSDGSRTVSVIVSIICEEYDAGPTQVESDVLELVRDLAAEKLVEPGP